MRRVVLPVITLSLILIGSSARLEGAPKRRVNGFRVPDSKTIQALAQRPLGPILFRRARVFDVVSATRLEPSTVVVKDQRIEAVGPDGSIEIPEGAYVIDASGKTLLPGLWDMHAHLTEVDGMLHLAAGVTTVREMSNDPKRSLERLRSYREGTSVGPRVILAGIVDGRNYRWTAGRLLADSEAEAEAAVQKLHEQGYPEVKIYSHVRPEIVPALVSAARRWGMRVSGHVPDGMTAEEVSRLGFDEIHHVSFLLLGWLGPTEPGRVLRTVAYRAGELDVGCSQIRELVALLKRQGTVVDPTLSRSELLLTQDGGRSIPAAYRELASHQSHELRELIQGAALKVPPGMEERFRNTFTLLQSLVGVLYRAGVPLVVGSDFVAGFAFQRELELLVGAGIPAPEVLRLATLGAASIAGLDHELGSISEGKLADLVLVDGDPAVDISDVRRVVLTVKDGSVYYRSALYQAMEIRMP